MEQDQQNTETLEVSSNPNGSENQQSDFTPPPYPEFVTTEESVEVRTVESPIIEILDDEEETALNIVGRPPSNKPIAKSALRKRSPDYLDGTFFRFWNNLVLKYGFCMQTLEWKMSLCEKDEKFIEMTEDEAMEFLSINDKIYSKHVSINSEPPTKKKKDDVANIFKANSNMRVSTTVKNKENFLVLEHFIDPSSVYTGNNNDGATKILLNHKNISCLNYFSKMIRLDRDLSIIQAPQLKKLFNLIVSLCEEKGVKILLDDDFKFNCEDFSNINVLKMFRQLRFFCKNEIEQRINFNRELMSFGYKIVTKNEKV
jgi:hypothetical protein